jgi:glycosyltransferase involved in cell wall biosynthesis
MRVCLICVEMFGWGKYGGFGRATRTLGSELVRRGVEVHAVVPRRHGQRPVEMLDGMRVLGFPMLFPPAMASLFREVDADVYHAQHPSLAMRVALEVMPHRRHLVTFRDPKTRADWLLEFRHPSRNRLRVALNWLFEDGPGIAGALHRLDGLYCAAPHLNEKLREKYRLAPLDVLPTPVRLRQEVAKSERPTVCFVGRWDRRKRPQLFFELARHFPDVEFLAVGGAQDTRWERQLRERYGGVRNLRLIGVVDQFRSPALFDLLARSWILVNTAAREGLPTVFLEALAHRCALLSHVDPDGVASRFGEVVADDDFAGGLKTLLQSDSWRAKGLAGYHYVRANFEVDAVVDKHLAVYRALLERPPRARHEARSDLVLA